MPYETVIIDANGSLLWHNRKLPGTKWVFCRLGGLSEGFASCGLDCPFLTEHKNNNHTVTLNCGPREVHLDVYDDERYPKSE